MSREPDRAPGTIWCLSRDNLNTYARTEAGDQIVIAGPDWAGGHNTLWLSRRDARLLAKRINECLDATVKR